MPLKLKRKRGSPYWYIRGTIRGRSVEESTGLVDRDAAEEQRALREAEIVKESVHGAQAVKTFAQAALSYMEAGGEKDHLLPIVKELGRSKLAKINQAVIDDVADKLKPDASPATRNRQIYTPISAVLNHAARKGWCNRPVLARPKQPEGRLRWITYDEADRLIEAASPHLRPLVVFLLCTGARLSEALYLDWSDVDLERAHVSIRPTEVRRTKSMKARGVHLHPRAVAALSVLPHRKGPVFRTQKGLPYASRGGKGGGQTKTAWKGMCRRAGITDFTPHDCRHTWATWHYAANRDLIALMKLGGWESEEMVLRYAHINVSNLAPTINAIWEKSGNSEIGKVANV